MAGEASFCRRSGRLVVLFLLAAAIHAATAVSDADRDALLCISSSLSGLNWQSNSSDICRWQGVTCDGARRVTGIIVPSAGLAGSLPPCVGNLTELQTLYLPNNLLTGPIPPELGRLRRLQNLTLSLNSLSGEIPSELSSCTEFQTLSLRHNALSGKIPASLGELRQLRVLVLGVNNLHGSIPDGLAGLKDIDLSNNLFSGSIPPSLSSSTSLTVLNLTDNSLAGEIPPELLSIPSLLFLNLANNHLAGEIPSPTNASSKLQYLGLSSNGLSGEIPVSIGKMASLLVLLLANNALSGTIPAALAGIPALQQLDLSINNLTGTVPPTLYNMSSLTYLGLGANQLTGTVPDSIGTTLPELKSLVLQGNKFTGPIPASLAAAAGLAVIDLSNNQFTGVIPSFSSLRNLRSLVLRLNRLEAGDWSFFTALANCTQLTEIHLNDNRLNGSLPSSVGSLSPSLEKLHLSNNRISGRLPAGISNLRNLTLLYLDQNELTGPVPPELGDLPKLFVLNLGVNRFSGGIPASLGNLRQLSELCLEDNRLTGSIPPSLAGCTHMAKLNLSFNSLDGEIPKEIFSLTSLSEFMDLSFNQLTGPLPRQVGQLQNLGPMNLAGNRLSGALPSELGQCLHLESLVTSGNRFTGGIPQSLSDLRGLVVLDLSQNQLTGEIPEFLSAFTSLQRLNLSFNDFRGPVPSGGVFGNASEVALQGNPELCAVNSMPALPGIPPCIGSEKKESSRLLQIVLPAVLIPTILLLALCLVLIAVFRNKRNRKLQQPALSSFKHLVKLSYGDIVKATGSFAPANFLGSGSFGSVYRARFIGDEVLAVKVFNSEHKDAARSFVAECDALRYIRHRNLVGVVTACSTVDSGGNDFLALVFEYMPNGNLDRLLHPKSLQQLRLLTLMQRISIIRDIASALVYLHGECGAPMVHCDLKPSNVLLDDDMTAKVGDFGLARFLLPADEHHGSTSMAALQGSIGYIAPEYGMGGRISTEGDVYSFGIVVLEILTGKRPTDEMFRDGLSLRKLVEEALRDGSVGSIVDPRVWGLEEDDERRGRLTERCVTPVMKLGLKCSSEQPAERGGATDARAKVCQVMEELA